MKCKVLDVNGDVSHIALEGPVTQTTISPFADLFRDHLGADVYAGCVILDMSSVEMLDSSGVGWLLTSLKRFRTSGGRLILHSLTPRVQDVFRVLHLQATIDTAPSFQAARERAHDATAPEPSRSEGEPESGGNA